MGNADIALRHVARRHPEDLARAFLPEGASIDVSGWMDTQVTSLERRLDKALRLRVGGEPRVLAIEFFLELRADVPARIFEYTGYLFNALRAEAPAAPVPPIESVAIVLSGRRRRWPARGAIAIGWPERPFSGARFRIDAVYQRTIAELRARGSVLWLVFAPLARDAGPHAMREVIAEIHARARDEEEAEELFGTMLVLAEIDPWRHNLREKIEAMMELEDIKIMDIPFFQRLAARKVGKAREDLICELLGNLFARRVGRVPTKDEERSLVQRAEKLGPTQVENALLDLDREALVRWLAEPLPQ
jgi:hypothetical protein